MALLFHQSTFDLLDIVPHISEQRLAIIAEREKICGISFPKSIREWYSIEGVEDLFYENTNKDGLIDIEEIGDSSDIHQGYLYVAVENQAVVGWYAKLDNSEDPPVFHNNDEWDKDFSTIDWVLCSKTFSNFIFDMISSHHFNGWESGTYLSATDLFPDTSIIEQLRRDYTEGPITDYPDSQVRRFFNSHGTIIIAMNTPELIANNLAEWNIETDSLDTLYDFAYSLWGFYDLSKKLAAESCSSESRKKGNDVLKRLHKQGK